MTIEAITIDTAATPDAAPGPRRARRARRSASTPAAAPRRGQRASLAGDALIANLAEMVDQLIKENRDLKRALARAEKGEGGGNLGQAARTLSGLQRRLNRALESAPAGRRRRGAAAPA